MSLELVTERTVTLTRTLTLALRHASEHYPLGMVEICEGGKELHSWDPYYGLTTPGQFTTSTLDKTQRKTLALAAARFWFDSDERS